MLFTKDVVGAMGSQGEPEVIPAGGQSSRDTVTTLLVALAKIVKAAQAEANRDRRTESRADHRREELTKRVTARRSAPIPDAKNAGPSVQDLFARHQIAGDERIRAFEAACREAEAAYAARNPHKRGRA